MKKADKYDNLEEIQDNLYDMFLLMLMFLACVGNVTSIIYFTNTIIFAISAALAVVLTHLLISINGVDVSNWWKFILQIILFVVMVGTLYGHIWCFLKFLAFTKAESLFLLIITALFEYQMARRGMF